MGPGCGGEEVCRSWGSQQAEDPAASFRPPRDGRRRSEQPAQAAHPWEMVLPRSATSLPGPRRLGTAHRAACRRPRAVPGGGNMSGKGSGSSPGRRVGRKLGKIGGKTKKHLPNRGATMYNRNQMGEYKRRADGNVAVKEAEGMQRSIL